MITQGDEPITRREVVQLVRIVVYSIAVAAFIYQTVEMCLGRSAPQLEKRIEALEKQKGPNP